MKFYAPYRKFRVVVDGIELSFPQGMRYVADDNLAEIRAIKKIPEELGQIRNQAGEVVNRRKIKSTKKKGVPNAGDRQKKA